MLIKTLYALMSPKHSPTEELAKTLGNQSHRIRAIEKSGMFDANWYAEKNRLSSADANKAIEHYIAVGAELGLSPHPLFDVEWFRSQYGELFERENITPLEAFLSAGTNLQVTVNPLFDSYWYCRKYDLQQAEHPLLHFIRRGGISGFWPHPTFDSDYYLSQDPSLRHKGINPLTHFVEIGWKNGLCPNKFFNLGWYTTTYKTIGNPFIHFLLEGIYQGHSPHPNLDIDSYLAATPTPKMSRLDAYKQIVSNDIKGLLPPHVNDYAISVNPPPSTTHRHRENIWPTPKDASTNDAYFTAPPFEPTPPIPAPNNDIEIVSFDIWDTILRRDCHPDEIKARSARYLLVYGRRHLKPALRSVPVLVQSRMSAENASAPKGDHEYRFEDALHGWLDSVLIRGTPKTVRESLRSALISHELAAEVSCTRIDQTAVEYLNSIQKPAVFLSDFYMSAEFVKRLLHHHGIADKFLTGFTSSDCFETKRSGALFTRTMSELAVTASGIFHVGDNSHADVASPTSLGIRSHHFVNHSEASRRSWYEKAFNEWRSGSSSTHAARIKEICNSIYTSPSTPDEKLKRDGAQLAPFFAGYILAIIEQAIDDEVEKVFFFTREGIFLRQLYDQACQQNPYDGKYPNSQILAVSRRATFAASLQNPDTTELMRLWNQYSQQSLRGLASSLNLEEGVIENLARSYGIGLDEQVTYPWLDNRCLQLFRSEEFVQHAREKIAHQKKLLTAYLKQQGIGEKKLCLIVDVGWRGTIQDNIAILHPEIFFKGFYIGLFKFLNQQTPNCSKIGWLFDHNKYTDFSISEVAPVEMILNSPGGSVVSYSEVGDQVIPTTHTIQNEESVVKSEVSALQEGIIAAFPEIMKYVRTHALTSTDLHDIAREVCQSLITNPSPNIADAFNRLEHNETFGTGETAGPEPREDLPTRLLGLEGSDIHSHARDYLARSRWPESKILSSRMQNWWKHANPAQRRALPIQFSALAAPAVQKIIGSKLSIFAPAPIIASGGHRTIFNVARKLAAIGLDLEIFLEGIGDGVECVEQYLDGTPAQIHMQWHRHIPTDFALATIAHSSQFIRDVTAHHKGYLVQDYEALFNPMSDGYIIAENSYTQGHQHFTIGNWLSHVINFSFGAPACAAGLGVDTNVYKPIPDILREKAVCFLYQPDKPRRTPILGIEALRILKTRHPDIKVYVYGSQIPINVDFEVENLGLVRDLNVLNTLYNRCMAGLCISASNPSRIPYEMMAAGCVPIDLYRYNNLLDHKNGTILLAFQDPASIAEALAQILLDPDRFAKMNAAAASFARTRTLDWETDVIANGLISQTTGSLPPSAGVEISYTDEPVICAASMTPSVSRFCSWQRHLASIQSSQV